MNVNGFNTGLKVAVNLFAFALYGFKSYGDVKRHSTHEDHHQLCDCMAYCVGCVWATANAKAKKQPTR